MWAELENLQKRLRVVRHLAPNHATIAPCFVIHCSILHRWSLAGVHNYCKRVCSDLLHPFPKTLQGGVVVLELTTVAEVCHVCT